MPRKRASVELPDHVHRVKSKGRFYYYFHPHRGTPQAGERVPLPADPFSKEFGERYRALLKSIGGGLAPCAFAAGTIGRLVHDFAGQLDVPESASADWQALAESTQRNYRVYLEMMVESWGSNRARDLRPSTILAARDAMRDRPFAANSFLAIGSTLFQWGIPREFAEINPFREIKRYDTDDTGHVPWPEWAWQFAISMAWEDLARYVYIAVQTGQRESDVVRLGPPDRDGSGVWIKPKKTGRTRGRFWVPLTTTALIEFERMEREPVTFPHQRYEAAVVPTRGNYVFSRPGNEYTPTGLRSRWNRWIDSTAEGKELIRRWTEYCHHLAERFGESFDPADTERPTLHGLRGSAVVIRRMAGATHQQIANDIGMSIQMVSHYTRFMDQKAAAESNIVLLEEADRRRKGGK